MRVPSPSSIQAGAFSRRARQLGLDDLAFQLDLAPCDEAEQRLGRGRGGEPDAGGAAVDDTGLRRANLGAGEAQLEFVQHRAGLGELRPGDAQAIAREGELAFGLTQGRGAALHDGGGGVAGPEELLSAVEGEAGLGLGGLRLLDAALGLGNGGVRLLHEGGLLGKLPIDEVVREAGEHLAPRHPRAFLHQHLRDPVALDLRRHQDLVAGDQGAGDDHRLDDLTPPGLDHADRGHQVRPGGGRSGIREGRPRRQPQGKGQQGETDARRDHRWGSWAASGVRGRRPARPASIRAWICAIAAPVSKSEGWPG